MDWIGADPVGSSKFSGQFRELAPLEGLGHEP